MDESNEVNGDISNAKNDCSPCPQRKYRLNRRGFYMSNRLLKHLLSDKTEQEGSKFNGLSDTQTESLTDSQQKKTQSLSSIKRTASSSENHNSVKEKDSGKYIILKKSLQSGNEAEKEKVSSSGDSPPKKKHKPITWP